MFMQNYWSPLPRIIVTFGVVFCWIACSAQTTITLNPVADTLVRSTIPGGNYGSSGALSVSGSSAVNGSGQQNGLFDTLMRFQLGGAVSTLDSAYSVNHWTISSATLQVTEVGAPANAILNRGVGSFEIRWIATDNWLEGTGGPNAPTADGVSYQSEASLLNSGADVSLGNFSNMGANGQRSFALVLTPTFVNDLRTGGDISLFLTAASSSVGFNFNSREFGSAVSRPALEIVAIPEPAVTALLGLFALVLLFRSTVKSWTPISFSAFPEGTANQTVLQGKGEAGFYALSMKTTLV